VVIGGFGGFRRLDEAAHLGAARKFFRLDCSPTRTIIPDNRISHAKDGENNATLVGMP
jgi:hypothetical protein